MCGIAGIVGLADKNIAAQKIRTMSDSLSHRGPDAEGFFVDEGVALGHRRLSIIDLSENANQPLFDSTGRFSIILNGEIYNYREVKLALPDYPFQTNSDTEAIVAAYTRFGPDCLELLNGMFAFAIWDKVKEDLFVARDRLGVKPLYYSMTEDGVFVFASEIRAILNSGLVDRKLSKGGLYDYLMYQSVYSPRTIVEGIYQIPAGEFGVFSGGKLKISPYWKIEDLSADEEFDDEIRVKAKVRGLLTKAVERRLVSDVRLGAFLSGGIDSSTVVGLMAEVTDQPVDTFSVTFGEKEFDESRYSDLIAKRFSTRHTSVSLAPGDFLDELPDGLRAVDSPSGDGLNTYVVSKATKAAGIKVALSGLGGDELFAGYPNFLRWTDTQNGLLPKIPGFLRKTAAAAIGVSSTSKHQRMAEFVGSTNLDLTGVYPLFRQVLSKQSVNEYCRNGTQATGIQETLEDRASSISKFPLLSQFSIAEMLGYTQSVLLKDTDQFSMASALEVREPFFDYKLVEYVLRIPDRIKYPKFPKSLLVESVTPLLPDEIVHRRKMGFVLPWERWMRTELKGFCETRLTSLAEREIVSPERIRSQWADFVRGSKGVTWSQLWHIVVLADWLETNKF